MRKGIVSWLVCLICTVGMAVCANAMTLDDMLMPSETCEHVWKPVANVATVYDEAVDEVYRETRRMYVDAGDCHYMVFYMMYYCSECGAQQEFPNKVGEPHKYLYTEYAADKINDDMVYVSYKCEECEHFRKEKISISALREAELVSSEVSCMHGGACPTAGMFDDADFGNFVQIGNKSYSVAYVLDEDGKEKKLAARLDCPFCGRPQMLVVGNLETDIDVQGRIPELTVAEFMKYGANSCSPYNLIDYLRELAYVP